MPLRREAPDAPLLERYRRLRCDLKRSVIQKKAVKVLDASCSQCRGGSINALTLEEQWLLYIVIAELFYCRWV